MCEDGSTFLSHGWTGPDILIANPGVPINIDPSVSNDKAGDATWAESQAVKDMDNCDQKEWDAVFGCRSPQSE